MDDPGRGVAILTPDRQIVCANATWSHGFPGCIIGQPSPCHNVLNAGAVVSALPARPCAAWRRAAGNVMLDLASNGGMAFQDFLLAPV